MVVNEFVIGRIGRIVVVYSSRMFSSACMSCMDLSARQPTQCPRQWPKRHSPQQRGFVCWQPMQGLQKRLSTSPKTSLGDTPRSSDLPWISHSPHKLMSRIAKIESFIFMWPCGLLKLKQHVLCDTAKPEWALSSVRRQLLPFNCW